ncbi:hypothetical protein PFHG_01283 [Plasmodium falciparum HB3]|uniref:Uncharacterized protein n=1 Tax=Plasmodium falciparum (isolate HB3) TaxID=137071 RepID=A0A0L7K8X1_PLAFX|nr:hypothetical protein PFHG_01283 [Plasmodium falciparum HB3]
MSKKDKFSFRYYVGHEGKFGHEFLEFEFNSKGRLRYANNSNYKNDKIIRKEAYVSKSVLKELKRIIEESEICKESDKEWPMPDKIGKQELENIFRWYKTGLKHLYNVPPFLCTKNVNVPY